MPTLRIALAQVNPTVGDLDGNAAMVADWTRRAAVAGARLVVFPEMMITGYPVEDLALRASFVDASIATAGATAQRLAAEGLGQIAVVTGYLDRRAGLAPRVGLPAGAPLDAAALLYDGAIQVTSAKHHLPNYGVFDEFRYFVPGDRLPLFRMQADGGQVDVAIAICEDLWQDGGPVQVACAAGAALLAVPNASPYERGKLYVRQQLSARRAREAGAALAYANMVGGQDELVFDGGSLVVDAAGHTLAQAPQFCEQLLVTDLDLPAAERRLSGKPHRDPSSTAQRRHRDHHPAARAQARREPRYRTAPGRPGHAAAGPVGREMRTIAPRIGDLAEVYAALVLGTADYVRKNGFGSVLILGLSGGIDSALTATIAADAIGAGRVHVRARCRAGTPQGTRSGRRRGPGQAPGAFTARTVPVRAIVDAYNSVLDGLTGLAAENLQSRVRGVILMALSNQEGHLVLTTGQQERDSHRLLDPVRRRGGRIRADQGRVQDAGLGISPGGGTSRPCRMARPRRSRRTRSPSRPAPSCGPVSLTRTRCPTTRYSTRCSMTTSRRTWGRRP